MFYILYSDLIKLTRIKGRMEIRNQIRKDGNKESKEGWKIRNQIRKGGNKESKEGWESKEEWKEGKKDGRNAVFHQYLYLGFMTMSLSELRTFAPIVSAHPYCSRAHTQIHIPRHASRARTKY